MTHNAASTICAVVVTHNRSHLLEKALTGLFAQTRRCDRILVVDNASTDNTREMLSEQGWLDHLNLELIALQDNFGGAGGFAIGLQHASAGGSGWIWMMDDDAEPHPTSLEALMRQANDPSCIYGSLAVNGPHTAWLTTVLDPPLGELDMADEIPDSAKVQSLPFLGFLIHSSLVARIGLPDSDYFIAADDVEYCVRAQKAGASIIIVGKSRIEHPKSRPVHVHILGRKVVFLSLPPWKRYYDTRNRLLIARKYFGIRLFTQTIPGTLVRMFVALLKEPNKLTQLYAFTAGLIDGLLGIKGKRHDTWGIR
ncbi:MAG: glycosyltransferase [Proteobacteria bacterium]|nr:glycosyltransferase [Pseudomonadota bacterium]